jgi:Na+/melibiose symporter-like transporter
MGVVLAAGFLVSALLDLVIGAGLQRRMASAVSASRIQLVGALLCSAALALVFLGAMLPVQVRFPYAIAASITFRVAFASYDIPQNALMALATSDGASRSRVAATRIWGSGAATLLVAAAVGPVVSLRGHSAGALILLGLTALFAVIAVGSAWLLTSMLRGYAQGQAPAAARSGPRAGLPAEFFTLLFIMAAGSIFTPAFSKLEPYYATYAVRSPLWGTIVIVLMALGVIAGQSVWMRLCRRLSFGSVMLLAAVVQLAGLSTFWWAGAIAPAAAATAFVFGLGNGGVGMVLWAAFSEVVARLGPDRAGLSYGVFGATGKIALAAGGLLIAAALARIDYHSDAEGLVVLMAVLPGIGALACAGAAIGLRRASTRVALARR